MYGDFPAVNTVCTPYIPITVWFWPTLYTHHAHSYLCMILVNLIDRAPHRQSHMHRARSCLHMLCVWFWPTSSIRRYTGRVMHRVCSCLHMLCMILANLIDKAPHRQSHMHRARSCLHMLCVWFRPTLSIRRHTGKVTCIELVPVCICCYGHAMNALLREKPRPEVDIIGRHNRTCCSYTQNCHWLLRCAKKDGSGGTKFTQKGPK